MFRTLMMVVVAATLAGAAVADSKGADSKDAASQDAASGRPLFDTAQTGAKDRGWFARVNPFSPLVNPDAIEKKGPETTDKEPSGKPETPGSQKAVSEAAEGAETPALPKLNGILFSQRLVVAIVNDAIAKAGDLVDGFRITSITRDTILAERGGVRYVMTTRRPEAQPETGPQPAPPGVDDAATQGTWDERRSSPGAETADKPGAEPSEPNAGETDPLDAGTASDASPDGGKDKPREVLP